MSWFFACKVTPNPALRQYPKNMKNPRPTTKIRPNQYPKTHKSDKPPESLQSDSFCNIKTKIATITLHY